LSCCYSKERTSRSNERLGLRTVKAVESVKRQASRIGFLVIRMPILFDGQPIAYSVYSSDFVQGPQRMYRFHLRWRER